MGLFSSSYKYFQSISFQPMKDEPFGEYRYSRKQIAFATVGNARAFGKEIWKYKKNYRHKFNSDIAKRLDAQPEVLPIENLKVDGIHDYIENYTDITDFQSVLKVWKKENRILDQYLDEDEFPTPSQVVEEYMGSSDMPYKLNADGYDFYCNYNSTDKFDGLIRWKIISEELSDDSKIVTFTYNQYRYEEEDDPDSDDDDDTVIVEYDDGESSVDFDSTKWFYAKCYYIDTDGTFDVENNIVFVPYDYYTGSIYESDNQRTMEFAPIFQLKGDNEPVDVEIEQKRMLKSFGLSLDSVQGMIDNGDIDDFRLGFAIPPDDAAKSAAIAKYLFEFFDAVGGDPYSGRINLGTERNRKIEFSVGDGDNELVVETLFHLEERVVDGQIDKDPDFAEYKVKLKQKMSNADIYYDDVKEIYDDAIGGSETDITQMYNAVVDAYNNDNDTYKSYYDKLPPEGYNRESLIHKYTYAFCTPADMDAVLFEELNFNTAQEEDDPVYEQYWEIESYKRFRSIMPSEEEALYVQLISDTNILLLEDPETGDLVEDEMKSVSIVLRKNISDSQYKEFHYRSGKLDYEIDGHTASVYHERPDKTFRLFMMNDYLAHKRFKEYTSIYDRSLCGLAYCQVRIKVRWYEKSWFKLFLQIAAVVITVWTAGSGAGLGATLMSMASTYAIAYVAMKIAEAIGGELGVIIGTVVAAASMYFNPAGSGMSTADLWLSTSDMYLKLESIKVKEDIKKMQEMYDEFKSKIDKQIYYMEQEMAAMDATGYSQEAIIMNIANRAYNEGYSDILFTPEIVEDMQDEDWKLPEVKQVDYDLAETLYNQSTEIPRGIYEFEHQMNVVTTFGANQNNY